MKPSKAVTDHIIGCLKTFREHGIEDPPYVCISGYPFEGILRTEYGSVRFVMVQDAEDQTLYVVSRRDWRLMQRRKARQAAKEKLQ